MRIAIFSIIYLMTLGVSLGVSVAKPIYLECSGMENYLEFEALDNSVDFGIMFDETAKSATFNTTLMQIQKLSDVMVFAYGIENEDMTTLYLDRVTGLLNMTLYQPGNDGRAYDVPWDEQTTKYKSFWKRSATCKITIKRF